LVTLNEVKGGHARAWPFHVTGYTASAATVCPSWARARTLLIQRRRCNRLNSSNLLTFREFVPPAFHGTEDCPAGRRSSDRAPATRSRVPGCRVIHQRSR